jgi:hypothetical protein
MGLSGERPKLFSLERQIVLDISAFHEIIEERSEECISSSKH